MSWHDFIKWNPPKIDSIIGSGILMPQTLMFIHSMFGSWKSMFIMHTAYCITTGEDWLGYPVIKSPVLIEQMEMGMVVDHQRAAKFDASHQPSPHGLWINHEEQLKIDTQYGMNRLDKDISDVMKISVEPPVVIIDPLYKAMAGSINDSQDVSKALTNLDFLKLKHNVAFIIVHHDRQTQLGADSKPIHRGAEEMGGNLYNPNWADTIMSMYKVSPDKAPTQDMKIEFEKHRNAPDFLPDIYIRVTRSNLTFDLIRKTLDVV